LILWDIRTHRNVWSSETYGACITFAVYISRNISFTTFIVFNLYCAPRTIALYISVNVYIRVNSWLILCILLCEIFWLLSVSNLLHLRIWSIVVYYLNDISPWLDGLHSLFSLIILTKAINLTSKHDCSSDCEVSFHFRLYLNSKFIIISYHTLNPFILLK